MSRYQSSRAGGSELAAGGAGVVWSNAIVPTSPAAATTTADAPITSTRQRLGFGAAAVRATPATLGPADSSSLVVIDMSISFRSGQIASRADLTTILLPPARLSVCAGVYTACSEAMSRNWVAFWARATAVNARTNWVGRRWCWRKSC